MEGTSGMLSVWAAQLCSPLQGRKLLLLHTNAHVEERTFFWNALWLSKKEISIIKLSSRVLKRKFIDRGLLEEPCNLSRNFMHHCKPWPLDVCVLKPGARDRWIPDGCWPRIQLKQVQWGIEEDTDLWPAHRHSRIGNTCILTCMYHTCFHVHALMCTHAHQSYDPRKKRMNCKQRRYFPQNDLSTGNKLSHDYCCWNQEITDTLLCLLYL